MTAADQTMQHSETWTVVLHRKALMWQGPRGEKREHYLTGPGLKRVWWARDYPVGTAITIETTVEVRRG